MTTIAVPERDALTPAESDQLAAHETTIERGLDTFLEIGRALRAIRDAEESRAPREAAVGIDPSRLPAMIGHAASQL
jgi:hypothetical protein